MLFMYVLHVKQNKTEMLIGREAVNPGTDQDDTLQNLCNCCPTSRHCNFTFREREQVSWGEKGQR